MSASLQETVWLWCPLPLPMALLAQVQLVPPCLTTWGWEGARAHPSPLPFLRVESLEALPILSRNPSRSTDRDWETASAASSLASVAEYTGDAHPWGQAPRSGARPHPKTPAVTQRPGAVTLSAWQPGPGVP